MNRSSQMADVEDEDVIEDDHFGAVLNFPPEVQEAIDQVHIDLHDD